ncbi:UDP-D-xylose:ribitol-5-phosphate beta1,4-xylosyltransferase [Triplophysa tibetana]|uniref:UDP-D-xylose:ribitol-5-phosphate beta1,4-xylosyltransferase n=1 Tax=Triplophysa tibetana TaxID=1572043 RepID=A0A5A9NZM0_9TELE|nr:UDP-D-xylose:ribitol-5-phosphate beta1,4-xylosyltransferase [Triplophysa tibetana]
MRFFMRKIVIVVVLAYGIFSLYAAYNVFFNKRVVSRVHRVVKKGSATLDIGKAGEEEWNPWEADEREQSIVVQKNRDAFRSYQDRVAKNRPKRYNVQIWGKAAIGLYLWEHILEGPLNPPDRSSQWREGEIQSGKINFSFYTGPAVVQGHVSLDTDSGVLVLNGRVQQKISYSIQWLQYVQGLVQAHSLSRVAVVLLGNEQCNNDWISPYLKRNGGFVDLLFLVYDSPWVNDKDIFQWPLGVATYRNFPVVTLSSQMVNSARPYLCNFLGTVYKNSSRETLMSIFKQKGMEKECLMLAREKWFPQETTDTSRKYQMALAQSDLTLCPVGINTECYRIYEACAYGSVPVVEDVLTPGACSADNRSPLRLLKDAGAPFIFLKDWRELSAILEKERGMSQNEKAERRMRLLEWYNGFRQQMKDKFTEVLEDAFFKVS